MASSFNIIIMTNKLFSSVLLFFVFLISAQAQCGSSTTHHKTVKSYSMHKNDIVDIAASDDGLSTLVLAVKTADLVETLKSDGPFTVFAPTNAAFAKIDAETIEALLKPEGKEQLTKILTYHVIAGNYSASDIINAINLAGGEFTLETVSGDKLMARISGNTVLLEDENGRVSAVAKTDISASNGVVHVIDSVVLPK
jgi:uncharacterized surface protein with fasciclin (FAS1) repeats